MTLNTKGQELTEVSLNDLKNALFEIKASLSSEIENLKKCGERS